MKRVCSSIGSILLVIGTAVIVTAEGSASETQTLRGLLSPVRIIEDPEGNPQVYAEVDQDAYFAMGLLHARARLFQMDYSRRLFAGTLAELLGERSLDSDIELRTLGLRRAAEASLAVYSPEALTMLEAYAAGVNAFLNSPDFELPPEYGLLELSSVEPWDSLDSVTIMKGIAFGLSFDLGDISRTDTLLAFEEAGGADFDGGLLFRQDLFRSAPFDPAVSIPGFLAGAAASGPTTAASVSGDPLTRRLLRGYLGRIERIPQLASALYRRRGSNFWLVDAQHSASGHALFANDPHLELSSPAIFYEIHLKVRNDPARGPMNVAGVSFPGVPGVVQGCNRRICWGSTVNPMDVTDVFEERLVVSLLPVRILGTIFGEAQDFEPSVAIPQTYRVNRIDSGLLDDIEPVQVGALEGGITYLVPRRNYGPIVSVELGDPPNLTDVRGLSIQYAGWRGTREGETFLLLARAENLQDFREALQYFDFGSQNWGYADVDGNIAYFTSGELPLREDLEEGQLQGREPWFVRDGTHQFRNEWLPRSRVEALQALEYEILPFAQMPQSLNPAQGFIINANNDPVGVSLDNDVLNQHRPGEGVLYLNPGFTSLRVGRIDQALREMLAESPQGLTLEDMQRLQSDNVLLDAEFFVPHILSAYQRSRDVGVDPFLAALGADGRLSEAVDRFRTWDFSTPTGIRQGYDPGDDAGNLAEPLEREVQKSVSATIYAIWRSRFVANTIDATLRQVGLEAHKPDGERSLSALRHFLEGFPASKGVGASGLAFFSVEGVNVAEDARDILILRSLSESLDQLASAGFAQAFGESSDQNDYRWGLLHRVRFDHPFEPLFSVPPSGGLPELGRGLPGLAKAGGYEVVDASAHSVRANSLNGFMFGSGPARRCVAELDPDGIRMLQTIPGGPAGNPQSPSYFSQLEHWLTNQYREVSLEEPAVEGSANEESLFIPDKRRVYAPYVQEDNANFTGLALASLGGEALEVSLLARTSDGSVAVGLSNPAVFSLDPAHQMARLGRELIGLPADREVTGWLELDLKPGAGDAAIEPLVAAFIQLGDFALQRLDGTVVQRVPARRFFFPRYVQGKAAFLGQDAVTRLFLANPSENAATLSIALHPQIGAADSQLEVRDSATAVVTRESIVPPFGLLQASLEDLFPELPPGSGYIEVTVVEGGGLIAFAALELSSATTIGLEAQPPGGSRLSYSSQLAAWPSLFTSVKLINSSPFDRLVTLKATRGGADDNLLAGPFPMAPGDGLTLDAAGIFQVGMGEASTLLASLIVEANGPGIIGDVLFGDPEEARFAAGLALQREPFRAAVFGHVANLDEFFTGLALFNPNQSDALVTISVHSPAGALRGRISLSLGPGNRISGRITELVPESAGMVGGYIHVESSLPLAGQELFGTFDLRLQSAVPPTWVR